MEGSFAMEAGVLFYGIIYTSIFYGIIYSSILLSEAAEVRKEEERNEE